MARKSSPVLTDQELAIMKIVWEKGRATVRDVYEAMRENRQVAYTTVLTMMGHMEGKGHLRRSGRRGRAYVYEPSEPKSRTIRAMVEEFVDRVFQGSATPLLMHLLKNKDLTPEDLQEARRIAEEEL